MKNQYDLILNKKSTQINLRLPNSMLQDLAEISDEFGTSIEFQIIIYLARSLERNYEMKKQDDELLKSAFKKHNSSIKKNKK